MLVNTELMKTAVSRIRRLSATLQSDPMRIEDLCGTLSEIADSLEHMTPEVMSFTLLEENTAKNRKVVYGQDAYEAAVPCAMVWTAILNKYYGHKLGQLTPSVVHLMKAADKILRASPIDRNEVDDIVDARAYLQLAWDAKERDTHEQG